VSAILSSMIHRYDFHKIQHHSTYLPNSSFGTSNCILSLSKSIFPNFKIIEFSWSVWDISYLLISHDITNNGCRYKNISNFFITICRHQNDEGWYQRQSTKKKLKKIWSYKTKLNCPKTWLMFLCKVIHWNKLCWKTNVSLHDWHP